MREPPSQTMCISIKVVSFKRESLQRGMNNRIQFDGRAAVLEIVLYLFVDLL